VRRVLRRAAFATWFRNAPTSGRSAAARRNGAAGRPCSSGSSAAAGMWMSGALAASNSSAGSPPATRSGRTAAWVPSTPSPACSG